MAERQKLLEDLQSKTANARAEEDSIMNIRYEELAKLIESMKPVDAGPVLNNLSDFAAAKILIKMKKRQAGRVMNVMDVRQGGKCEPAHNDAEKLKKAGGVNYPAFLLSDCVRALLLRFLS